MNHSQLNSILALILPITMMATLWSCSKEEDFTDSIDRRQCELSLTVRDGGYAPAEAHGLQTRVTDDGYKTTFTIGDMISLYAVDKNGSVVILNCNLQLRNVNGELKWQPIGGGSIKFTPGNGERFFVCYPADKSTPSTVDPSANTADGFFADKIAKWSPYDYQEGSTYISSDLMVGMGTPGEPENGVCPLTVRLSHQMALMVISPPKTRYKLSSDNAYTWIADANLTSKSGSFHYMGDGIYRYLVKPSAETTLSCTFVNGNGDTRKFDITATIPAGRCKTFTIDGAATTEKIYTMQTGDYYLEDGSLVSKDQTLNSSQKDACIGVVVKAGKAENDDCTYMLKGTSTPMPVVHGYVLALKNANSGYSDVWGTDLVANSNVGTEADLASFSGYTNTQTIISYVKNHHLSFLSYAAATYRATENYESSHAAPANTSGWFLPSAGQCKWWFDHGEELLSGIEKAGGDKWGTNNSYWSSTENGETEAYTCSYSSKALSSRGKKYNYYIRSWLGF